MSPSEQIGVALTHKFVFYSEDKKVKQFMKRNEYEDKIDFLKTEKTC